VLPTVASDPSWETKISIQMKVSPTEAADIAGVTRKTLYADMNKGHLSFEVTDKGKRLIQIAELERVYSKQMSDKRVTEGYASSAGHMETLSDPARREIDALRQRLESLQTERQRERDQLTDQIDHLRDTLKSEQDERRRITALLTDQRQVQEKRGGEEEKRLLDLEANLEELKKQNRRILTEMNQKKRGLWERIFQLNGPSTVKRPAKA
jgi:chromosome segregation ATPase